MSAVTVDQIPVKDISSKYVPFTLPICKEHNVLTELRYTKKIPEERIRRLRVVRVCRCPECFRSGLDDLLVINHRDFP